MIANNPNIKKEIENNRELIDLFPNSIFVEVLPSGFYSDYLPTLVPWFKVTTKIGHFVIGWRKRVISIEWKNTVGTKTSKELFANEDVTKWDKGIHAWSLENAKRYILTIMENINE